MRKLVEADIAQSYKWRNDPEIWSLTGSAPSKPITYEAELSWFREVEATKRKSFAIMSETEFVGICYLNQFVDHLGWELSLFIGEKQYWGTGIGKECVRLLVEIHNKIHKNEILFLKVRHNHIAAQKIYFENGFKILCRIDEQLVMVYE